MPNFFVLGIGSGAFVAWMLFLYLHCEQTGWFLARVHWQAAATAHWPAVSRLLKAGVLAFSVSRNAALLCS